MNNINQKLQQLYPKDQGLALLNNYHPHRPQVFPTEFHRMPSLQNIGFLGSLTPPVIPVGGWVELGRQTLGSAASELTVTGLADKRHLMCLVDINPNANMNQALRFNAIVTGTYARRSSANGGGDATGVSISSIFGAATEDANPRFLVYEVANLSAQEKLVLRWDAEQQATGATNVPARAETVGKHAQTTNPISSCQVINLAGGTRFDTGSELVVLGKDPADVHTNNFFVEEGSASGSTLDITLSTARKYTWTQFLVRAGSAGTVLKLRAGNGSLDSSSLYPFRQSDDGTADTTTASADGITLNTNSLAANELLFVNIFMINVSAREKLWIIHTADTNTGAGASNAPGREEIGAKYVFTSNLVNHIGVVATSGSISATSSQGKSWGGD